MDEGVTLVTGARGHIGSEVSRVLRAAKSKTLLVDVDPDSTQDVLACDIRLKNEISRIFQTQPVRAVIHLAGILPSAFRSDPLAGAEVNLGGSFELMRQAVNAHVKRFVFASSMSVYGSSPTAQPLTESDPAVPDEPYGGSKRVVELVGEALADGRAIEFVSLRVARVIGPGIRRTSSPWRSQIFEPPLGLKSLSIPFAPEARLSLVHVEDVARMLVKLVETVDMSSFVYNTPVEIWEARSLKEAIEEIMDIPVELGASGAHGGTGCDGGRFVQEFGFQLRGLRDRLLDRSRNNPARSAREASPTGAQNHS